MWSEFKAFLARGNVLDLAIGVIIGAAFGKIVTTFTEGIIMPFVGMATGGVVLRSLIRADMGIRSRHRASLATPQGNPARDTVA